MGPKEWKEAHQKEGPGTEEKDCVIRRICRGRPSLEEGAIVAPALHGVIYPVRPIKASE